MPVVATIGRALAVAAVLVVLVQLDPILADKAAPVAQVEVELR
jgi:hypothetical protein